MPSANRALLSLCLLFIAVLAMAPAAPASAPHRRLQLRPRFDDDDPRGPPVVPPAVVACWKSILASGSCVDDLLQSLAALEVRVGRACCSVLERIGDRCVVDALSSFPLNPAYPPLVKHVCGLAA